MSHYVTKNQNWWKTLCFLDFPSHPSCRSQATHATTCLPRVAAFANGRWNTFSDLKVKHPLGRFVSRNPSKISWNPKTDLYLFCKKKCTKKKRNPRWWLVSNIFDLFSPRQIGEDEPILTTNIFQMGWLKPPTREVRKFFFSDVRPRKNQLRHWCHLWLLQGKYPARCGGWFRLLVTPPHKYVYIYMYLYTCIYIYTFYIYIYSCICKNTYIYKYPGEFGVFTGSMSLTKAF